MKEIILFISLAFSITLYGQSRVDIKIDSSLIKNLGGIYVSQDGVMIMPTIGTGDVEELVNQMKEKNAEAQDLKIGKIPDTNIYFSQKIETDKGEETLCTNFLKEQNSNEFIILMTFIPMDKKSIYNPIIIDAIKSAKIEKE